MNYVGRELEHFALARNWKSYVRAALIPYLLVDVAAIGAGLGLTVAPHNLVLALSFSPRAAPVLVAATYPLISFVAIHVCAFYRGSDTGRNQEIRD